MHGCTVHEAGAFCHAPPRPPPSSPPRRPPNPDKPRIITFAVPPSAPVTRCRSCGAGVIWIVLPTGRRMPVNADTRESHFATCPDAQKWRRTK